MARESDSETMWTVTYRLEPDDLRTTHRREMRVKYRRGPIYTAIFFMVLGGGIGWLVAVATDRWRPVAMTIGAGLGLILFWTLVRMPSEECCGQPS